MSYDELVWPEICVLPPMKALILIPIFCLLAPTGLLAQKPQLNIGVGGNFGTKEIRDTNTIGAAVVFAEVGLSVFTLMELRYSIEGGPKFEGEVVNTSLPPQKYGNNYLLNQYLKAIRYIGSAQSPLRPYIGLGYLLNYQRPYATRLDENDAITSTGRVNNWSHGGSAYIGLEVSKFSLEASYHLISTYPDFAAIKLGYSVF